MRQLRLSEVKYLGQGHAVAKWQSWDFTKERPRNFARVLEGTRVVAAQQDSSDGALHFLWSYLLHSRGGRCTRQENCPQ